MATRTRHRGRHRRAAQAKVDGARILSEILQPRAEETSTSCGMKPRAGYEKSLNSGIVLTGGGSISKGCRKSPNRFSTADQARVSGGVGGLADHVNSPTFATPVDSSVCNRNRAPDRRVGAGAFGRWPGGARNFQGIF